MKILKNQNKLLESTRIELLIELQQIDIKYCKMIFSDFILERRIKMKFHFWFRKKIEFQ